MKIFKLKKKLSHEWKSNNSNKINAITVRKYKSNFKNK